MGSPCKPACAVKTWATGAAEWTTESVMTPPWTGAPKCILGTGPSALNLDYGDNQE